jgi:XisI protein
MDKIAKYQQVILELLEEYSAIPPSYPTELRDEVVADTVRNHFQLITLGWEGTRFVYEVVFHLDLIDGKVWIQQNNTEANLAEELCDRGIPKSDLVIGFQPAAVRALSGYAVA